MKPCEGFNTLLHLTGASPSYLGWTEYYVTAKPRLKIGP